MTILSFDQVREMTCGKFGAVDVPCPLCGPERRSIVNRHRKTLRLGCTEPSFISYHCAVAANKAGRAIPRLVPLVHRSIHSPLLRRCNAASRTRHATV
jgi:hypothetical protein